MVIACAPNDSEVPEAPARQIDQFAHQPPTSRILLTAAV